MSKTKEGTGKRGGRGSHGGLNKAGFTRSLQPKQWGLSLGRTKHNLVKKKHKRSKIARVSNRRKYEKRFILKRDSGQHRVK